MASRKEQKEQLRREREQRDAEQKATQRRRQMMGYGAGGAAVLVIVVVAVVLLTGGGDSGGKSSSSGAVLPDGGSVPDQRITDLSAAAKAAGCTLKSYKGTSREHTDSLDVPVKYASKPPTEGKHFVQPADDGAYDNPPDQRELVHTMEHGRVIVWFKKNLDKDKRAGLKALFDEDSFQMVMTPDPTGMSYQVAATAWSREPTPNGTGRLLGCPTMNDKTYDAIRAFRDEYRGNGPEAVP